MLLNKISVGHFDHNQQTPGKISMFNMWDYKMSLVEIMALSCSEVGNVVNWDTLKEQGSGPFGTEFLICQGKILIVPIGQ